MFKGEFIFSSSETDRKSAATFLILLLDCFEKWSEMYQQYEDGKYTALFKAHQALIQKGVKFPS